MDKYVQLRVLGKGSFGAAWLVQRRKDGGQFVAKEVKLAGMKPSEREMAKHEIDMLKALNHPNITRYVDHFEHRGSLFIVMEYANGGDLYTKIKSRRGVRFSEKDVLHFFLQLCLALYHMHEKRVLHRDLKSQNVFLTQDGVVKLGDFGISTVLRNTYELKRTVCGTPYYFSPELCMNKPYNNKSDVWALGCILYELTTLNHAFDGTNMKALVQKILRGVYPPIHASYSRDLSGLIQSMLAIDPAKRPHIQAIVSAPYARSGLAQLQSAVTTANKDRKSCVDQQEKERLQREAATRQEQEKKDRERKEREWREKQGEREREHQRRIEQMRRQMENEVQEHEDKLRRIRDQQRIVDAKRKAEAEERQRRLDDERKLRGQRQAEQAALLKKREEEWERNMKAAQREREAKREAAERESRDQAREARVPPAVQQHQHRRATPPEPPVAKAKAPNYDPAEAARAFHEMRQQAAVNRRRLEDPKVQSDPPPRAPAPDKASDKAERPAPKERRDTADSEAARREAYWQMRREAEENKRRLMGLDPTPVKDVKEVKEDARPSPPPAPAAAAKPPTPAPEDDGVPLAVDESDDDGDVGYHKFLNNDAVAGGAAEDDTREAAYRDVGNNISVVLEAAVADPKPFDDFSDPELEPGRFVLDGQTLHLPNVSEGDPLGHRVESLRLFLEHSLGDERFLHIYRILSRVTADDDDEECMARATALLEKVDHKKYLPVVVQLIVCEEAVNEQANC